MPDVAGAAPLAIAGVASSADLAGMTFPVVTGVASPVDLAGMAFPAIVGEVPAAEFSNITFPAIAEAALIVVEVASSTDSMEPAGPSVYTTHKATVAVWSRMIW